MRREFSHYSADLPMFSRTVVVLLSASTGQSRSLRQFSNFHRDPPRLVFGEQLGRRSPAWLIPAWLILGTDIGKLPAAVIAHDIAGVQFLDGPRRREAAWWHLVLPL